MPKIEALQEDPNEEVCAKKPFWDADPSPQEKKNNMGKRRVNLRRVG